MSTTGCTSSSLCLLTDYQPTLEEPAVIYASNFTNTDTWLILCIVYYLISSHYKLNTHYPRMEQSVFSWSDSFYLLVGTQSLTNWCFIRVDAYCQGELDSGLHSEGQSSSMQPSLFCPSTLCLFALLPHSPFSALWVLRLTSQMRWQQGQQCTQLESESDIPAGESQE